MFTLGPDCIHPSQTTFNLDGSEESTTPHIETLYCLCVAVDALPERRRILLVGSRLLPFRHAGDKNFWLDVIARLPGLDFEVEVLSVTLEDVEAPAPYPCHYVRPIPMFPPLAGAMFNEESSGLRGTNNYTSKTVSFPRLMSAVRAMSESFHPDVIHFIDNYGPVMLTVRPFARGIPTSISAPTYNRVRFLYDFMLLQSLWSFDRVVPYTHAYANRLLAIGLDHSRVRRIPWGVDVARLHPPSPEEREAARTSLGIGGDTLLVGWSGFTQQATERDLEFAAAVARRTLKDFPKDFSFHFCFKPEHFRERYRSLESPGMRVHASPEEFTTVRLASDLLISPLVEGGVTVGPPLTWLEFMAMGVPIMSTPADGVEEAVIDSKTGLIVETVAEASDALEALRTDLGRLRGYSAAARRLVTEEFTADRSAQEYASLWREMAEDNPRRKSRQV